VLGLMVGKDIAVLQGPYRAILLEILLVFGAWAMDLFSAAFAAALCAVTIATQVLPSTATRAHQEKLTLLPSLDKKMAEQQKELQQLKSQNQKLESKLESQNQKLDGLKNQNQALESKLDQLLLAVSS
jgi:septal ring factor EnvC (AmiA/AmiB activator)